MSAAATITVLGADKLAAALEAFRRDAKRDYIEAINEESSIVARALRAAAPVGPTGNLRKSIVRKTAKDERGYEHSLIYISTKRAPHRGLVIFGTKDRYQLSRKYGGRKIVFRKPKFVGKMRPHKFFAETVRAYIPDYVSRIETAMRATVKRRAR